jgi:3-keto-L-gulonate-6-phosphate decarboxylase
MPDLPLLQLSLDFTSLPAALAVALRIASAVDVIEVGTPRDALCDRPPVGGSLRNW